MTRNRRNATTRSSRPSRRLRIRATLGDLIAAAYDALGPEAGAGDVARLLSAPAMARYISPRGPGLQ
jgi:hypothetical protein